MTTDNPSAVEIIDIHSCNPPPSGSSIRDQLVAALAQPAGQKTIPTILLYDERGLRLYDEITTSLPEYYLFPAEERILKNKAEGIIAAMHGGVPTTADEVVVELGAG